MIFSIVDLIFSILLSSLRNLVRVFQFFRQIEKQILILQVFRLKNFANFEKKFLVSKKKFKFAVTHFLCRNDRYQYH